MRLNRKTKPAALILMVVILAVGWYLENRKSKDSPSGDSGTRPPTEAGPAAEGDGAIEKAFREKRSKVWVEDAGRIVHLLPDDRRPPRHQLCLVELASGHTIKISHNVDLAPKVPWRKGDRLAFRGRFEFNDKGGVVHWTHHDPKGRKPGGWLQHDGKRYR